MSNPIRSALLMSVLALVGCSQQAADTAKPYSARSTKIEVEVASVQHQALTSAHEFTGNLLPRRVTRISAEVSGVVAGIPLVGPKIDVEVDGKRYVEQLGLSFGQVVRAGDVLAQLDTTDAKLELAMAKARLAKARADLKQLQAWKRPEEVRRLEANKAEAVARHAQALREAQRLQQLAGARVATESEREKAKMDVQTSKALVDVAEANLAVARSGPTIEELAVHNAMIDQAQAEVNHKQSRIDKATLRAPFDAVLTSIDVEVGDHVSPTSGPVAELMDLRYLVAEIGIPEAYSGKIHRDDRAEVTLAGSVESVPGLVIAINDFVDPQTRTFQVRVAIDNAERKFKAGQFAKVQLALVASGGTANTVPTKAITYAEGQPIVFVVRDGRAKATPVELGLSNTTTTQILDGLNADDTVVTDDPSLLYDGVELTIRNEK